MSKTWRDAYGKDWKYGDSFDCSFNKLSSLVGAPERVDGQFDCKSNRLTSLKGAPSHVGGNFNCSNNKLTSIVGAPSYIGASFLCNFNIELKSLKNIHLHINHIGLSATFEGSGVESSVLGLLLIDGLRWVSFHQKRMQEILSRYLPSKGMESVFLCQEELIMAGYEEYAQL